MTEASNLSLEQRAMQGAAMTPEERKRMRLSICDITEAQFDALQAREKARQVRVPQPGAIAPDSERTAVATLCRINLDPEMPMLVDAIDNRVEESCIAPPMRLSVIGREGRIAHSGERGPFGFNPDTWEAAIKAEIG